MKKFFKFLGIAFVLFIIAFAAVLFFTSDLTQTVDDFFNAVKNNNYTRAEHYLSGNFKSTTTVEQLKRAFPHSRFKYYSGCSFKNREVDASGTGTLKGSIKFSDGSIMPIKIELIKENDEWKINHISLPRAGLTTGTAVKNTMGQHITMVHKTIVELVNAILSRDYSKFYSETSTEFKQSVSKDKIKRVFGKFSSVNINWKDIGNMSPVITFQKVKNNGILEIKGYYPTKPEHLGFRLEYVKNNGQYKIFGIFIKLEK